MNAARRRWHAQLVALALPAVVTLACDQGADSRQPVESDQHQLTSADKTTAASAAGPVEPVVVAAAAPAAPDAGPSTPQTVWVIMKDKAPAASAAAAAGDWRSRGKAVHDALVNTAAQSQAALHTLLAQKGIQHKSFWIMNAMKVEADQATLAQIAQRSDVAKVVPDRQYAVPPYQRGLTTPKPQAIEWGVQNIRAPEVWSSYGFKGDGIVVANVDTGVEYNHPALVRQYRGTQGDGSYDHNYNWFDPASVCGKPSLVPCDNAGHGTHTMGTMVGDDGDPGDNQVGVAPHARWIAAKGCESMYCTSESLLAAAQWILAPTDLNGQNPRPDLRPHVVNNSWGGGYGDEFFRPAVQAWVDAGIFPAIANGNSGPYCGSANSPGDYPESYSAGAYDETLVIADWSSRGPSYLGEIKPNVAAPGVNVRSSVPGGSYEWHSGTSMATPHLSGTVALMWSAAPALVGDIAATRAILDQAAVDTADVTCAGDAANNNVWGQGRLDALNALDLSPTGPAGTLRGTVTGPDGLPVRNAKLLVQGGARDRTVTVAPDGTYQTRVSVGSYTATARAFGYLDVAATVAISEGATTVQDFTLALAPTFAVGGTVRITGGGPVVGAQVTLVGTPLSAATTDANGRYSFAAVPAGNYEVRAQGTACYEAQVQTLALTADATLDFSLPQRLDGYGYHCVPTTFAYVEANTVLPISYYDVREVALPFPFTLYGQTYETATIASTGHLSFQRLSFADYYNVPIPAPSEPNAAVYPFWDDVYVETDSSIRTEVIGTAPHRQLVVEWRNVVSWDTGLRANFEVLLSEDGKILMQYQAGQDPWQQGLMATIGLENETGTTAFQYSYNQPSVAPQSAVLYSLPPSGTVQGTLTDANDQGTIAGATVQALQGAAVVSTTTSTPSGFYRLILPAGSYTIVVTKKNYDQAQASVSVALDQTVQQSFALKTPVGSLSPATLQALMPIGQTRTRTFVLKNTGSAALSFTVAESGGRKLAVTPTRKLARSLGYNLSAPNTRDLSPAHPIPTAIGVDAAGDIIKSFAPSGVRAPWGVGFTGNVWLSDLSGRTDTEFTPDGAATGATWPTPWAGDFPGDMAYHRDRDLVCQVAVGGDNGIHCWKRDTGVETDKIVGSFPWTRISQRGLAYRADDDSFYVGGWNDMTIYHIKGLGASDKGTVISSCMPADGDISGLAYNPAMGVLWVATNSYTDTIYELNPDDCTVLATLTYPSQGYGGAGLDMDDEGNLWMVNQNNQTAFLMDSGVPAFGDVPWLTPTPTSGTVAAGKSATITVKLDTTGLSDGIYLAAFYLQTNAAKQALIRVPVSLVVTAYQQGVVAGGAAYTDLLGDAWAADRAYSKGSWGYVQKSKTAASNKKIAGTTEQPLFKTQRIDPYAYRFDSVPNGIYEIALNFAELNNLKMGKRLYDVIVENTEVLPAHDIVYEVGTFAADKHVFFVEVTDNQMDVRLIPRAGYQPPVLNSLRVTHRPDR